MAEHDPTHGSAPPITVRDASTHDSEAIAALHADSWRRHYRGAYRDAFLDGDVLADRRAVWSARLAAPSSDRVTKVADHDGLVLGFVHLILNADPHWGTLLDNLHVTHWLKRHGIGRWLLTEAARELVRRRPADRRLYLWVLDQNTPAQAFYAACGGTRVETTLSEPFPGGGRALCQRIAWPDVATLAATLTRG